MEEKLAQFEKRQCPTLSSQLTNIRDAFFKHVLGNQRTADTFLAVPSYGPTSRESHQTG